ncbi:MAG: PAS domain S-box protein, partial [Cyanobacteria bacterium REEB65]|nr:PAS domain S-box protein [Cyanobacteria bacterium REEB65]
MREEAIGLAMEAKRHPDEFGIGTLFYAMHDAIIVGDTSTGTIVLWNPGAERLFGYTAEEAIGQPMAMLVPEHLKEAHNSGIARYAETGAGDLVQSHRPIELPSLGKDGSEVWIEMTLNPVISIYEHPGKKRYVLALLRDISERKQAEAALRELNSTQMQLMRSERLALLGGLVAGIAHEINTPLGTAVTAITFLEGKLLEFKEAFESGQIKRSSVQGFLSAVMEATDITTANLKRAAELMESFKRVSVDRTNDARRQFYIGAYIDDIIRSLSPKFKGT